MKLDANGLNEEISASVLPEEKMRELGFTDHLPTTWYFSRMIDMDISFNVSIPKDGGRLRVDVLDEDFGQPYDYQSILKRNPGFAFAEEVKVKVEALMEMLADAGIIHGFTKGMYL